MTDTIENVNTASLDLDAVFNKAIHIEEGRSNHILYFKKNIDKNDNALINLIKNKEYNAKKGDKIYLHPETKVPRFKIKNLCMKEKIRVVKDRSNSTVEFIGIDRFPVNNRYYWGYLIPVDIMSTLISSQYLPSIKSIAEDYKVDHVMVYGKMLNDNKSDYIYRVEGDYTIYNEEEMNMVRSILSNHSNIYLDSALMAKLNSGLVMDEEIYTNIKRLLASSDNQNIVLAMETMANCDYSKSCVYLLNLVREYGQKIYNSKTVDHVNFKSFLNFFNIPKHKLTQYIINDIVDSLIYTNLLTQSMLNELLPQIERKVKDSGDQQHFKIQGLEYSETLVQCLEKTGREIVYIQDGLDEDLDMLDLDIIN